MSCTFSSTDFISSFHFAVFKKKGGRTVSLQCGNERRMEMIYPAERVKDVLRFLFLLHTGCTKKNNGDPASFFLALSLLWSSLFFSCVLSLSVFLYVGLSHIHSLSLSLFQSFWNLWWNNIIILILQKQSKLIITNLYVTDKMCIFKCMWEFSSFTKVFSQII